MNRAFRDRAEAGRALADRLTEYAGKPDVLVLALPRGGVPVGFEVARTLGAPLDVFLVRKLGVPNHEELAMGAIASGGVRLLNEEVVRGLRIGPRTIDRVTAVELAELERRGRAYRNGRTAPDPTGRTVILIDDGLATGASMRAAVMALRRQKPARIVVAVPVAARSTCEEFAELVDQVVCVLTPEPFLAVGYWYEDFSQTTDEEVRDLLGRASDDHQRAQGSLEPNRGDRPMSTGPHAGSEPRAVTIPIGDVVLEGDLTRPEGARGLVLFAHGSGSSRHSRRNQHVARLLNEGGLATLLFDLLTAREEAAEARTAHLRFDIELLADRLVGATDWAAGEPDLGGLPIGYFGASTGGGAAIVAAAERPEVVGAIVSRGGRPDLAGEALPRVQAPTLLIVGSLDTPVIAMNRDARSQMRAPTELAIVPGASHLFEEPGKLDEVARLALGWFGEHLVQASQNPSRVIPE